MRKDLAQELHTKEMITSMGLYALLVLVVYGASLAQAGSELDIQQMAGGLLWVVVLFTSLLGLNRSFSHEKENGCLESILLVPMDRSVIFLAKATANLVFLLIVEVICVPLFFFFFLGTVGAAETWPLMFAPLLVGTIGIAGIGTLLSTITINTRGAKWPPSSRFPSATRNCTLRERGRQEGHLARLGIAQKSFRRLRPLPHPYGRTRGLRQAHLLA